MFALAFDFFTNALHSSGWKNVFRFNYFRLIPSQNSIRLSNLLWSVRTDCTVWQLGRMALNVDENCASCASKLKYFCMLAVTFHRGIPWDGTSWMLNCTSIQIRANHLDACHNAENQSIVQYTLNICLTWPEKQSEQLFTWKKSGLLSRTSRRSLLDIFMIFSLFQFVAAFSDPVFFDSDWTPKQE